MIIQLTTDKKYVLFNPENLQERKKLDSFPGLVKQQLQFYCPNKQHVVYNLFNRLQRKIKDIKYTPEIKELIEGDVVIKEIPADFHFHTKPLKHQMIALRFAYTFGNFLNLSEPGLGKTKVTLDYIYLMKFKKSLIVCPKALRFVWEDERETHRPELSVYVVETTDWEKEASSVLQADVVVVNYDKAISLESYLAKQKFEFIAVDEGLIKNPSTERTKSLTRLSKGIEYRSIMSGTLVNNSPLDVFAPLRFIEPSLVGESFSKFRDEYALASRHNRFITIGYRNVPEVKEMLASCSVIMTKAEWLKDLPAKRFHHKYIQMEDVQRDYYHKLASNYLLQLENGSEIEVDNPLSVLIKLNQISNGFVYYKDNEEETLNELYGSDSKPRSKAARKTYVFEKQPKAEALIRLINSEEFNRKDKRTFDANNRSIPGSMAGAGEKSGRSSSTGDNASRIRAQMGLGSDNGSISNSGQDGSRNYTSGGVSSSDSFDDDILRSDRTLLDGSGIIPRRHDPDNHTSESLENTNGRRQKNLGSYDQKCSRTDRRAIIWFNLAAELEIIERVLSEHKISYNVIKGGEKDVGGKVRRFNKDPSIRFLVCQAKTINYGVTIMGTSEDDFDGDYVPEFDPRVSDEIFYSLNFSLEVFLQQQDRIHRIGQTQECNYWLLLTNSKIERTIADRLEEKLICNKEILVDIIGTLDDNFLVD